MSPDFMDSFYKWGKSGFDLHSPMDDGGMNTSIKFTAVVITKKGNKSRRTIFSFVLKTKYALIFDLMRWP